MILLNTLESDQALLLHDKPISTSVILIRIVVKSVVRRLVFASVRATVLIFLLILVGDHPAGCLSEVGVPALRSILVVDIILTLNDLSLDRIVIIHFLRLFLCMDHALNFV